MREGAQLHIDVEWWIPIFPDVFFIQSIERFDSNNRE